MHGSYPCIGRTDLFTLTILHVCCFGDFTHKQINLVALGLGVINIFPSTKFQNSDHTIVMVINLSSLVLVHRLILTLSVFYELAHR